MTRRLVGAVASCLVLLAGLWLILAPFALGIQPSNADWVDQTFTDVWSGIGLGVVGLIAAVAFIAALIQHLAERGLITPRTPRREAPAAPAASAAVPAEGAPEAPSGDLDKLLAPLVAALAHDLEREHQHEHENGVDLAHVTNNHQPEPETPRYSANSETRTTSDQPREMPR